MFRPPTPHRRPALLGALVVAAAVLSGCGAPNQVTEHGADARRNFVDGCTTSRKVTKDGVQVTELSTRETCGCVYDAIDQTTDDHYLSWDSLAEYEAKLNDLKADETAPKPPRQLTDAMESCRTRSGPELPDDDEDATTTTEAG